MTATLDHIAVLDAELIRVNASVPVGQVPTDEAKRDAIRARAERIPISQEDICLYFERVGLMPPPAKTQAELEELARAHGFRVYRERGVDTGGNPYITLWLTRGTAVDHDLEEHRVTWHSRGHGTFRLFSMLTRKLDRRGWVTPKSLMALCADVAR
jgi:hypothetical protein